MKAHRLSLFFLISLSLSVVVPTAKGGVTKSIQSSVNESNARRILHQPLFPATSAPPPGTEPPPPPLSIPPPSTESDIPFFHEYPAGPPPDQNQPPPSPSNASIPIPTATQPAKPTKKVAIALSVGIVTLGMLSALAFYLYRHRVKQPGESQKLVGGSSQRFPDDSRVQPSSFLYIGTVEPSQISVSHSQSSEANAANGSPYHKLNSIKRSDRYRPSPELQPLPPLSKPPDVNFPPALSSSSSDEESRETAFHSPQASSMSYEDSYYTPVSRQSSLPPKSESRATTSVPHSKRTSPKSRLSAQSQPPDIRHLIIPSIKQTPSPPPPPPPPPPPLPSSTYQEAVSYSNPPRRPKFSQPPPPPNIMLVHSRMNSSPKTSVPPVPPPPPPPPPPQSITPKGGSSATVNSAPSAVSIKPQSGSHRTITANGMTKTSEHVGKRSSSSERLDADEPEGAKPKLKPLHWDKVRATSDRATVWDQLKSSSFQ